MWKRACVIPFSWLRLHWKLNQLFIVRILLAVASGIGCRVNTCSQKLLCTFEIGKGAWKVEHQEIVAFSSLIVFL